MSDEDASGDRLGEFENEVARLRIKGGSVERERQLTTVGLALAVIGVVLGVVAVFISSGASDSRDQLTYLSMGILGLTLTVAGSVLWLRYSLTRYLRFWLLRLIYEQRQTDS
jgi:protein-S-isoprenylcysteine O-methyltransferase Ste14